MKDEKCSKQSPFVFKGQCSCFFSIWNQIPHWGDEKEMKKKNVSLRTGSSYARASFSKFSNNRLAVVVDVIRHPFHHLVPCLFLFAFFLIDPSPHIEADFWHVFSFRSELRDQCCYAIKKYSKPNANDFLFFCVLFGIFKMRNVDPLFSDHGTDCIVPVISLSVEWLNIMKSYFLGEMSLDFWQHWWPPEVKAALFYLV